MNYLSRVCILLCAVTIYAFDITPFVEESCTKLMDEFLKKEECKNYQLPEYLKASKAEFNTEQGSGRLMPYFDTSVCAMEIAGIISEEVPFDTKKMKEHVDRCIDDGNMKKKYYECFDEETEDCPEDERNIGEVFSSLCRCLICTCMQSDTKSSFGPMMGC